MESGISVHTGSEVRKWLFSCEFKDHRQNYEQSAWNGL